MGPVRLWAEQTVLHGAMPAALPACLPACPPVCLPACTEWLRHFPEAV